MCSARSAPIRTMPPRSPTSWSRSWSELARHPKVVAIGEAGLDYHYDHSPRDVQKKSFRTHIAAARETGLPLIIHARDADADIARILEEETVRGAFPFVLHCFTGGADLARRGLALGGYISFSGVVTFKKADALRDIAMAVPSDRLLVETDAPYLAPEPLRGKTNEPAFVAHTAARLADLRGVRESAMARLDHREFLQAVQEGAARSGERAAKRRMTLKVTILGCGTSGGVPRIGNHWGACDPANPKNRRERCSLLVQRDGPAGADGRAGRHLARPAPSNYSMPKVGWLDGVLYTHDHADHTHGIDDLRQVCSTAAAGSMSITTRPPAGSSARASPIVSTRRPAATIRRSSKATRSAQASRWRFRGPGGAIEALPFRQIHGSGETLGFRFGGSPIRPDVSDLPEESLDALQGLDVWILDTLALHAASEPSIGGAGARLDRAGQAEARGAHPYACRSGLCGPEARSCREGVEPAYDGMVLEAE